jgi:acetylornithine/N-succinyldiaminopimelate aminotransferase
VTTYGERYAASLMNTFGAPKLVLTRGEGAHVWDENGKEYVDLLAGIAVNALGHAHPALVSAVTSQMEALGHVSNFFTSHPQVELAEALLARVPGGESGRVFFTNSGTEANEAGFKLTRRTGRTHIVAAQGAFHGRSMGALALTAKEAYRAPFEPLPGEVTFVPYGDASALAAAVTDETAAIILEPIQGEAGVVVPPADYLVAARAVADEHGALLWLDEVQSGVGRTGRWFAHETAGVSADIVTLAKGLGGGFPIGACIGLGRAATLFEPGNHGTTFGGNPVACAAGLAVIAVDPAYTSRWAAQHWVKPLQTIDQTVDGHRAAAVVIGRRGLGHRARRKPVGPHARQRTSMGQPTGQPSRRACVLKPSTTYQPKVLDAAGP